MHIYIYIYIRTSAPSGEVTKSWVCETIGAVLRHAVACIYRFIYLSYMYGKNEL